MHGHPAVPIPADSSSPLPPPKPPRRAPNGTTPNPLETPPRAHTLAQRSMLGAPILIDRRTSQHCDTSAASAVFSGATSRVAVSGVWIRSV